ncbi:hypothetical protein D5S17_17115 [Pseudonocardiaceae bacterium YIM PH 21723]|nr:hypothetical protein D5S17_17115 [Pseudonocardiaceae bacterium YIM PH 21723]
MSQLDITATNYTAGAGVIDSWRQVAVSIESLKDAHGADRAAVAIEIGLGVASGVLDTVAAAIDPLAKLISAGLGWLIEHVKFLRFPLDQIAGNPDQIKLIADQLHRIGQDLRHAATDMESALAANIKTWEGDAFTAFKATMTGHKERMDATGKSVDVCGYIVETTMALIAACRALFRDIITTVLGDIISVMLVALAAAFFSFGTSIVAGVATCVTLVSVQVASMMTKIGALTGMATRSGRRIGELAEMTHMPAPPRPAPSLPPIDAGPSLSSTVPPHMRPTPEPHEVPLPPSRPPSTIDPASVPSPPPSIHEPPAPPSPNSALKPQDFGWVKKHEDWLKRIGGESAEKAKWVDNYIKKEFPDAYPWIKGAADAKSSKNFAGWVGKDVVTVDRQLTDIQTRAEAAWAQSDAEWRKNNPNPA